MHFDFQRHNTNYNYYKITVIIYTKKVINKYGIKLLFYGIEDVNYKQYFAGNIRKIDVRSINRLGL